MKNMLRTAYCKAHDSRPDNHEVAMETLLFILVVALGCPFLCFAQEFVPTREPLRQQGVFSTFYAPTKDYEVTIESDNGVVSVLDISNGVFLSVHALKEQNPSREHDFQNGLPRTFHGDIIIRLRRADEMEENESRGAGDIMAKAPLEMTLKNAVVVVKEVDLPDKKTGR